MPDAHNTFVKIPLPPPRMPTRGTPISVNFTSRATRNVILSAAKDLGARRIRPFAALRVTLDGRPPNDLGGRSGREGNAYGGIPTCVKAPSPNLPCLSRGVRSREEPTPYVVTPPVGADCHRVIRRYLSPESPFHQVFSFARYVYVYAALATVPFSPVHG